MVSKRNSCQNNFSLQIKKISDITYGNLYNEIKNNAELIYQEYKNLTLFFSGGTNSQIILRTYIDLQIPLEIVIIRYNNNYNLLEFNLAKNICENFNVKHKVIDINLDSFFENEAIDIFLKCPTIDPIKLIFLKTIDSVDGSPILGNKFPYIYRNSKDYGEHGTWNIKFYEEDFVYINFQDRKIIGDWFHYSPEVLLSLLDSELVYKLISDNLQGKLSILTSRHKLFCTYWPNFINRNKATPSP